MLAALVASVACLPLLAWLVREGWRWQRWYARLAAIPAPQGGKGHVAALTDPRHHRIMLRFAQEAGPIFLLKLYHTRIVVVTDPALSNMLLRAPDGDKTPDYGVINKTGSAHGLPGLFSASSFSPYWKLVRRGVLPAFNPKNLRGSFPQIVEAGRAVAAVLRARAAEGAAVDVDNLLQRQALDVIGRVGFQVELGAIQVCIEEQLGFEREGDVQEDMLCHLNCGMDEVNRRWGDPLRPLLFFLPSVREGERHFAGFRAHIERVLRALRAKGPPADWDTSIAAHLLRIRDPATGEPLSDARLMPEIATLLIAGFDTTAHTMAWALYLLSQHPEAEARVCEELRGLGLLATPNGPPRRQVELEDLGRLPYLTACIKESMRMLPVAADGTLRIFQHEVQLGPYLLPAGTMIWAYFFGTFNSEQYWEAPEQFRPERWLAPGGEYCSAGPDHQQQQQQQQQQQEQQAAGAEGGAGGSGQQLAGAREAQQAQQHQAALRFYPFSIGPRDCVGQTLAKLNYTATLAALLGEFRFRLAPEMEGPGGVADSDVIRLTLQPAKGLKMLVVPRA